MANGNNNGNGAASKPGLVFGISNEVVAIVGSVAIIGIGAHLLGEWLKPKPRPVVEMLRSGPDSMPPTLIEAMHAECSASATHPQQVSANKDRVDAAIKQRMPRLQQLADRASKGHIGPDKVAEGIHRNARDVLDDLGIPSEPHPSAASPVLVRLFQAQREAMMSGHYSAPGQLILNTPERRYLEHEAMSYAATTDPIQRVLKREAIRDARELDRLTVLRQRHAQRQAHINQKEVEALQDAQGRRVPSRALQGSWYPLG